MANLRKPWADRGSRHARGYGSKWDVLRRQVMERDLHLCQPCKTEGIVTSATQVDHVKTKAQGGTDDPANLQAICDPCHEAKTAEERGERAKVRIGADGRPVG